MIIDCLYNTTNNADISKNQNISIVTDRIFEFKDEHKAVYFAVHHFNKNGKQDGLIIDRMSGGSTLQNCCEHILLLVKANEDNMRLLKVGKTRHTEENNCYYKLEFDYPLMKNKGVVEDWNQLLVDKKKMTKWSNILRDLNDDRFSTHDFFNIVD